MVKNELHIGQISLPYEVIWGENRSTIGIELTPDKELIVRAPVTASDGDIEKVLENKKPWLLKKLSGLEEQESQPLKKEYYSGEKLLYNGRRYRLKLDLVETDNVKVNLQDNLFIITAPEDLDENERREQVKSSLLLWYKEKAKENLTARANGYARKLDVNPIKSRYLIQAPNGASLKTVLSFFTGNWFLLQPEFRTTSSSTN